MDIGLDSLRTASKKVVHKTSKFLGNKIADTGTNSYNDKIGKTKHVEEIIIPPRKRRYITRIKTSIKKMEHYKISKLLTTKNEYILGFNPTNSSIATPLVSSFIFPMIICSNHHSTLTQSNNY